MERMKITVFADPVCTWCWGSVPVIRALKYRYGEQLDISYVMGVMIEDITTYNDRRSGIGGDTALSNRNIHKAWLEASAVHGMPVCESGFRLFSPERRSTLPQNRAFITASLYARESNGSIPAVVPLYYLRRIQEATAVDAILTNDVDTLADMSAVVGFEPAYFKELYLSDAVDELLKEAKGHCRSYEVNKFPTYILEYRNEEMMLRGYSNFDLVRHCIDQLSYNAVKPLSDGRELFTANNVKAFMEQFGGAYPVEIATAFSLARKPGHTALNAESYVGLSDMLDELMDAGEVAMTPRGNGFMFYNLKAVKGKWHEHMHAEGIRSATIL